MTARSDSRRRGIYPHGAGWRAVVSRGRGRSVLTRHFPAETPLAVMQDWRKDQQATARVARKTRASYGTFAGDAKRYLEIVAGLTTVKDRQREIAHWTARFGTRARDTITAGEIRAQRDQWVTAPRDDEDARPVAAATINKRLRALSNLYTVLDGRRAGNPVREVDELREPAPTPRAVPYATIAKIIAQMPDRGRPVKGQKVTTVSATKVRVRCLAYCQITPGQLGLVTPADLDLAAAQIHLPARRKGAGADAVWVRLLPKAVRAFRDFDRLGLYGPFSQHALRHSWAKAATKAGAPGVRPYDLRHTYGALIYRATGSREAVSQLLQHGAGETSARYAMSAEADVREAHGAAVVRQFG